MVRKPQIVPSGLIGHWKLDETSGSTITDYSGYGNTGTWTDSEDNDVSGESITGVVGTGLAFDTDISSGDGTDQINAGSATVLDNLGPMSVCMWVYPTTAYAGNFTLISKKTGGNDGWHLWVNVPGGNRIAFDNNMANQDRKYGPSNSVEYNSAWQFFCATWDGTDGAAGITLYKNGVDIGGTTNDNIGSVSNEDTYDVILGGPNINYEGEMDDVRIYNRELSASEIAELYAATSGIRYNESHRSYEFFDGNKYVSMRPNFPEPNPDGRTGYEANGVTFDGTNDYLSNGNPLNDTQQFTMSFWYRSNDTNVQAITDMGGSSDELRIEKRSDGDFFLRAHRDNSTSYGLEN